MCLWKQKITAFVLMTVLLVGSALPAYATDTPTRKEEVVYSILNLEGNVENVYIVNIFNGGKIIDYGNYTEIRNLTTSEKLNQNGDTITIDTAADKLYYQGTLESKELPWKIVIQYKLDGKEISGANLAGQSGALQIAISVTPNAKINRSFFDNYALQISLQLDSRLSENIKADNASIAEAGGNKQLIYTVLPGKGADISLTADVHDFEMEPITLNGIMLVFGMSVDEKDLTGQLSQLSAAIRELDDGAEDLLVGTDQITDGMKQYMEGLKAYKDGLAEFEAGASGLYAGVLNLNNGLSDLSGQNKTLLSGAQALQQAAFDAVNTQLATTYLELGLPVLTPQNYSTVLSELPDLADAKAQLDGAVQFTAGLKSYTDGVAQLNTGTTDLALGASQLKSSASGIVAAAKDLYLGGEEVQDALQQLRDGQDSYHVGTKTLRSQTANMDKEMNEKINVMIDSILGKGDPVVSFVSTKNTNISAVQFVLKTQSIERQETITQLEETDKLSFWQRLMRLFGF